MRIQVHRIHATRSDIDHADAAFGDATTHGAGTRTGPFKADVIHRMRIADEYFAGRRMHGHVE